MFMTVIYPISLPVTYQKNKYSAHVKTAAVRPIFKKDERIKKLPACKSFKYVL